MVDRRAGSAGEAATVIAEADLARFLGPVLVWPRRAASQGFSLNLPV